jgi:hypothetical protein
LSYFFDVLIAEAVHFNLRRFFPGTAIFGLPGEADIFPGLPVVIGTIPDAGFLIDGYGPGIDIESPAIVLVKAGDARGLYFETHVPKIASELTVIASPG